MEKRASEVGIQGVAVLVFSEDDVVKAWSLKMRVVGVLRKDPVGKETGANLLGIAYTKAAKRRLSFLSFVTCSAHVD